MFENIEVRAVDHRWVTPVSFGLQAFGVGLMLLIPLIYSNTLPVLRVGEPLRVPYAGRHASTHVDVVAVEHHDAPVSQLKNGRLMEPQAIPKNVFTGKEAQVAAVPAGNDVWVPGGGPDGVPGSTNFAHIPVLPARQPAQPAPQPKLVRVSNFEAGYLIRRVQPTYPPWAISAHVQGPVELLAVVDTKGDIERLEVLSGNPMLIRAAVDAVRQWKYRPYLLNGTPVEVETHVTVYFTLK